MYRRTRLHTVDMFYENPLYENYDHNDFDKTRCCQCFTGCCAGIKNMLRNLKLYYRRKTHNKPKNKNHHSNLLLGDHY